MQIVINGKKERIADLKVGDVFIYDKKVFMLIDGEHKGKAVSLEDGSVHLFSRECEIEKVSAKLIINLKEAEEDGEE